MGGSGDNGILKVLIGVAAGVGLSYAYVQWGVALPAALQLPGQMRDAVVSTAADGPLYDLSQPEAVRDRALEVMFQTRPRFAVEVDRDAGRPFLTALYRQRAAREARQARAAWSAFDEVLGKPALRAALERKHATSEPQALKQALLREHVAKSAFLSAWIEREAGAVDPARLLATLERISRSPEPARPAGSSPSPGR